MSVFLIIHENIHLIIKSNLSYYECITVHSSCKLTLFAFQMPLYKRSQKIHFKTGHFYNLRNQKAQKSDYNFLLFLTVSIHLYQGCSTFSSVKTVR